MNLINPSEFYNIAKIIKTKGFNIVRFVWLKERLSLGYFSDTLAIGIYLKATNNVTSCKTYKRRPPVINKIST